MQAQIESLERILCHRFPSCHNIYFTPFNFVSDGIILNVTYRSNYRSRMTFQCFHLLIVDFIPLPSQQFLHRAECCLRAIFRPIRIICDANETGRECGAWCFERKYWINAIKNRNIYLVVASIATATVSNCGGSQCQMLEKLGLTYLNMT